jgi:RNA polymerase sigma factor (sigma-70 family)
MLRISAFLCLRRAAKSGKVRSIRAGRAAAAAPRARLPGMDADLALLERWRGGDERAGQDLFARYFAELYAFLEHKAGDAGAELTQRVFLACLTARERFRGDSSFRTFLFAIARHELYRHLRSLRRDQVLDFEVTSIAAVATSPLSKLHRARQIERLRDALAGLPAEQQLLLELHYWHELDAAALAEVFACTPGAIRVRLLRARKALREQLGGLDGGEGQNDRMLESLRQPEA